MYIDKITISGTNSLLQASSYHWLCFILTTSPCRTACFQSVQFNWNQWCPDDKVVCALTQRTPWQDSNTRYPFSIHSACLQGSFSLQRPGYSSYHEGRMLWRWSVQLVQSGHHRFSKAQWYPPKTALLKRLNHALVHILSTTATAHKCT